MAPDPWQSELLLSPWERALLLCSRQAGKSTVTAALALHEALYRTESLTLLLAPALRQSQELFAKVWAFYRGLSRPAQIDAKSALRLKFANGSRIVSLPGKEKTVRGYSGVDLLIVDEAARVDNDLYEAVRPMLAVSGGRLMALTTPWGRRGWFYEAYVSDQDWHRVKVTARDCPRISEAFLEQERRELGDWLFRQEYLCEFVDTIDQLFATRDIDRAFNPDVKPLFGGGARSADDTSSDDDIEPLFA
jgi:hypothetical protein